jgi:predicted permease
MRIRKRLQLFLRALTRRSSVEAELDEEMRFHVEMAAQHHERRGLSAADARRRAAVAFGSVESHKEAMREGRGVRWLERIVFDLRFALRQLRATPAFTAAAVLTLALGIGGNVVVFGVVNGVLLRPLDYPQPDRIVSIGHRTRGGELPSRLPNSSATHVVYEGGSKSFVAMALYQSWQGSLTSDNAPPDWIDVLSATRSLNDVLRVPPAIGRWFTPDEDSPGGPRVAVLSHALWATRFAADSAIVGRTITLDGTQRTVVGVMPVDFGFPTRSVQVWVPMRIDRTDLGGFYLSGIGRLRDGITPAAASRELDALLPRVSTIVDFISPRMLRDAAIHADVRPYLDDVVGGVRNVLWASWAMTALVLLIACVNVGGLLLVRGEARRREVAVRTALGAEGRHLVAQSLAESAMLVACGGVAGAVFAWAGLSLLPKLAPGIVPRMNRVQVDATVLIGTAVVAATIAVIFGLLPFTRGRRIDPAFVFRGEGRTATSDRRRGSARQALLAMQIAMAAVLLIGSGLVIRSFAKLRAVDPGFRAKGVMTFRVSLPPARYKSAADVARFHYAFLDRLRALPGVIAAGATNRLPLAGPTTEADPVRVEGRMFAANQMPPLAEMRAATPGYFEAMGIPRLAGRTFERTDTDVPSGGVIVTGRMVAKLFADRAAVGGRVAHGLPDVRGAKPWSNVVGVVGDVRGVSLATEPLGAIYYPMVNLPGVDMEWLSRSMVYAVRSTSDPAALIAAARHELRALDPQLPLAETRTLESVVEAARAGMRFSAIGFAVAALIGLFMGAVGLYGVISYATAQRTREIGVRIALGASPASVKQAVVAGGLVVTLAGLGIGVAVAMSMQAVAAPLLYGVAPADALTFGVVTLVLLSVSLLATWLPARRAARLDPMIALRGE